jgi:glycosyltransferase involved in cell wall biosynthesis
MKILFVQRFCIETVGCAVRATRLCEELALLGHEVRLINFPHARRLEQYGSMRPHPTGVETINLRRSATALPGNIKRLKALARNCDIVHLWKSYPDASLPAVLAAYHNDLPLHYDWDDWEPEITRVLTSSNLLSRHIGRYERMLPTLADTVSVASYALREEAAGLGVSEDRLFHLPVGADPPDNLEGPSLSNDPPTLVYVGQLETIHQAELCLEVLAELKRLDKIFHLMVLGDGPGRAKLEQQAAEMGIGDLCRFMGYRSDFQDCLRGADIALIPFDNTQMERCKSPLKVAEALAVGLPIVSNPVGEVPAMVGDAGQLVPAGDCAAMAHAVIEVQESIRSQPDIWKNRLFNRAKCYTWRKGAQVLQTAYQTALDSVSLTVKSIGA